MAKDDQNKYRALAALDFDHRSPQEAANALARPTLPAKTFEARYVDKRVRSGDDPFLVDAHYVTGDYFYRRLGALGQLAPTFSPGFQNRMTHTQHAARIAEQLCQRMALCPRSTQLAQTIVYTHDIGHAPFSHEGEHVFNNKLTPHGGRWDHDAFGFRLMTEFAYGGVNYHGLPLTNATLEGMVKRYQRYRKDSGPRDLFTLSYDDLSPHIQRFDRKHPDSLKLGQGFSPIEGQIAAISDWIAGTVSDSRDMLLLNLHQSKPNEFVAYCDQLFHEFPIARQVWERIQDDIKKVEAEHPQQGLSKRTYYARMNTVINLFASEFEDYLVSDVLKNTYQRYSKVKHKIRYAEDVRGLDGILVQFSDRTYQQVKNYNGYFAKQVFPWLLRENVDTIVLMDRFYDIVKQYFEERRAPNGLTIDDSWMELYHTIKTDNRLDAKSRELQLSTLVAEYITCNFNDSDVLYYIRLIDPEFHAKHVGAKKKGLYPQYSHPDEPASYRERIAAERMHTVDHSRHT